MLALSNQPTPNRMSSREVADLTGKNHADVMRDIRHMQASLTKAELLSCVESSTYTGADNREYPMYLMDKDTTICLLTGYDVVARMKVVKRWQELESGAAVPKSLPEALRAYALELEAHEETKLQLVAAKPAIDFYNQVAVAEDAMPVAEAAKLLGVGPNKLFAFLREEKLFMNGQGGQHRNMPYQKYIDAGYFTVVEQTWQAPDGATHIHVKPMVYQKGLEYIRKRLDKQGGKAAA